MASSGSDLNVTNSRGCNGYVDIIICMKMYVHERKEVNILYNELM